MHHLGMFVLLLLLAAPAVAGTVDERVLRKNGSELRIEMVGVADRARAKMLQRCAAEAARTTLTESGRFPLQHARVRISQRAGRGGSPAPWGQTARRGEVSVLMYVRDDATFDELRRDWTTVHEFSHLFHPYLGDRGRWLAECVASYCQNLVRARAGLLDADEAWRRLDGGFARGRRATSGVPLSELGRGRGGAMRVYWAGAAFWLEADLTLRRQGGSLDAVLAAHADCCLRGTAWVRPADFVAALDKQAGAAVFTPLHARYAAATTFPDLADSYAELGLGKSGTTLHFSRNDAARACAARSCRRTDRLTHLLHGAT